MGSGASRGGLWDVQIIPGCQAVACPSALIVSRGMSQQRQISTRPSIGYSGKYESDHVRHSYEGRPEQ